MQVATVTTTSNEQQRDVVMTVNGIEYTRHVSVRLSLADFLRHELELTGTHLGCEHGVCGACTILLDGASARACLTLAVQCHGHDIVTVEGLSEHPQLNTLQQAFMTHHALQCGFCTPGMLITITELLREHPQPSEADVRTALSGNLCRCTGYAGIVAATLAAAAELRKHHR